MSMTETLAMSAGQTAVFPANPTNAVFLPQPVNGVARVQVTGNFTGSAIFEETLDGLTWFASPFAFADLYPISGIPTIGSSGGTFTVKMPGSTFLRVRCTVAGTGTAVILVAIVEGSDIGLSPFASAAQFSGVINVPAVVSATCNPSLVQASITAVPLLAANAARKMFSVLNDTSTATLYIGLGFMPSFSSYNDIAGPGSIFTPPINFTGSVYGLWDIASGNARISEFV